MQIKLSDHFTYGRLLRYTLPTIVMIIFTSLYSVVDGLFVSNLVGDLALSAVNIAFPITMIIGAFGFMLGTGGSAIVARTLGEGKPELASRYFTLFIWCVAGLGVVLSIVTIAFIEPIMRFAGASDLLLEDCIAYGRILLAGSAVFMLQSAFQSFFSVAEKPKLGLLLSLAAGATNITFDYVFIALLGMGVTGAAWATVLGYCVGGVIPVVYFLLPRREGLRLVRTNFYGRELLHACINGSSELMSNISASVVGILYNIRLMDLLGEPGVAAHSVMMYVDFVFVAAFLGFSMGSAPIVSYHYGAENYDELKNIFRGRIKEYAEKYPSATYYPGERPWGVKCDIAMPCATQNELNGDEAQALVDNGCMCVAEGANMPSTPDAIRIFQQHKLLYAPGKAANAGGVATSGLEMTQNSIRLTWSPEEVDAKLKSIMQNIHAVCVRYGTQSDGYINYVVGANIGGFMKVANAMLAQGCV